MAALFLLVSTLVALLSQLTIAEPVPQIPTSIASYPYIPYPFNPTSGYCSSFEQIPPFHAYCSCDLSSCFDVRTEAQLEAIATAHGLRLCDVQQWSAIIEGTMYGIHDYHTLSMVDQIAKSVRYEMDQRELVYDLAYPAYCNQLYSSLPELNPILTKRSPQVVMYPDLQTTSTLSPAAMESYYLELMYMARNAMPNLSPQLLNNLLYSIISNTPYYYMSLIDDVEEKLEMNIISMISEMDEMRPYDPLLL